MAEIVNLRMARKRAEKAERAAEADRKRIAFGLPKSLRETARAEADRDRTRLDGVKLGGPACDRAKPEAE